MSLLGFLGGLSSGHNDDKDCDWYCDDCGAYMNNQPCFTTVSGEWTCTECGTINDVSENNILYDEDDDDDNSNSAMDEINDIPEGCRACGGPYPNCTDSCPLFDD